MFRKQFDTAKLATETMGSGSSKKWSGTKQPAKPKAASSSSSEDSVAVSKPGTKTMSGIKKADGGSKNQGAAPSSENSAAATKPDVHTAANTTTTTKSDLQVQRMQTMMRKLALVRGTGGGKNKSKWESANVDDLMKKLEALDKIQQWYDLVDSLISDSKPRITPVTKRKGWRTVRLFISSTFKDMHSEREHLIKMIIPVLRHWCEERKLNLIECDLRWGVPKHADTRETLLTCLSEIDRCRQENEHPYFLSMLSERYGYVMDPAQVPSDIKARYKWLPGMSVTTLEIMTGAYWDNNPNEVLGHDHPTTVRSREDVIIILQNLGRDSEANKYLEQQPDTRDGIA